ncbi:hypothetical protein D9M68_782540 [compost metagenome]
MTHNKFVGKTLETSKLSPTEAEDFIATHSINRVTISFKETGKLDIGSLAYGINKFSKNGDSHVDSTSERRERTAPLTNLARSILKSYYIGEKQPATLVT